MKQCTWVNNMKAYSLHCKYLPGVQIGIQSAHSHDELAAKAFSGQFTDMQDKHYRDWLFNHKTMVVLDGGDVAYLKQVLNMFNHQDVFPYAGFYEEGLGKGVLTNVTIILPDVRTKCWRNESGDQPFLDEYNYDIRNIFNTLNSMRTMK